jgi:hypothetical protein
VGDKNSRIDQTEEINKLRKKLFENSLEERNEKKNEVEWRKLTGIFTHKRIHAWVTEIQK